MWEIQGDIVKMYVDEGLTLREIGEKVGFSRQTICNVLQEVGVKAAQKAKKPLSEKAVQRSNQIFRMYVDEGRSVRQIAKLLKVAASTAAQSLRSQGVLLKKGVTGRFKYPELRKLKIGESLELPRRGGTERNTYTGYYMMAKKAGIRVSVRVISDEIVKVTRKA